MPDTPVPARLSRFLATRWGTRLRWGVLLLALWLLLSGLLLPPLLRRLAETRATEALGRPVSIAALGFNPFTLAARVEGLRIAAAEPGQPALLEVAELQANLSTASLWRRAPVLDSVLVLNPTVRLARLADGHYDIDDLLQRFAGPPEPAAGAAPARFALYNLRLEGGTLELDDRPVQRRHQVRHLQLGLPFLSNLDAHDVQVRVEPRLAFELDGAQVDTGAQVLPFAAQRAGELRLKLKALDLSAWRAYLPAGLPVRPLAGQLSTDLQLQFAVQPGQVPSVRLAGELSLDAVQLDNAAGAALGGWRSLRLQLADVQPLQRRLHLAAVEWLGGDWRLQRDARGQLNWWPAPAGRPAAVSPAASSAGAAPAASAWTVQVDAVDLRGHRLDWQDGQTRPAAHLALDELQLKVQQLRWPLAPDQATRWQAEVRVPAAQAAASAAAAAGVTLEGQVDARGGELRLQAQQLELALARPYLAQWLSARLDGRLGLQAEARWSGPPGASLPPLRIAQARIDQLALQQAATGAVARPLAWGSLQLSDATLDLGARRLRVGKLDAQGLDLALARDAQGRWSPQGWLQPRSPDAEPAGGAPGPDWQVELAEAQLQSARLRWRDEATGADPVALQVDGLGVQLGAVSWPARPQAPWRVAGALRLQGAAAPGQRPLAPGRLNWRGQLGLAPLGWQGQVGAERLPLHLLAPYLADVLPVSVLRADLDWRGPVQLQQRPAGWVAGLRGDARLADLHLNGRRGTPGSADELLSWRALDLPGLQLDLNPGAPTRLALGRVTLADFYASLVVTEQGRLNLNDLRAAPAAASAEAGSAAPALAASGAAAASAPAAAPAAAPLQLVLGGVELVNGRVDFADHFIRPNYSAAISELRGQVGAFRWDAGELATLDLAGKVAGTAALSVKGRLNPTGQPLALDIQARATDLELSPLSPYAAKYAGYAIERGKLTMDVGYKIQPDGRLDARNQIILNQLTFGDKVDSPDATRLPVLFAVALLKDRNGVIDLDLPIGGSINDPQFSIGSVVVKIIVNLLTKALTAPFALLAGGGDHDLSQIAFVPGSAQPAAEAAAALDKVAKALADRPALQLTVTGIADGPLERDALRAVQLEDRLQQLARQERLRGGADPAATELPLAPAERERLLRQLYGDTRLPDKPRNLVGLAKELSPGEMRLLLLPAMPTDEAVLRALAQRRGEAVRDALLARGLDNGRIFLAAPRTAAGGEGGGPPGVALNLGSR